MNIMCLTDSGPTCSEETNQIRTLRLFWILSESLFSLNSLSRAIWMILSKPLNFSSQPFNYIYILRFLDFLLDLLDFDAAATHKFVSSLR